VHLVEVMAECAKGVYRPRRPRETPFYRIVEEHFERFEQVYAQRYEDKYGYLRPVIRGLCPETGGSRRDSWVACGGGRRVKG